MCNQSDPERDVIPPQADEGSDNAAPDAGFDAAEAEKQLLFMQQELRALGIPVVIVLEGWNAAGKGTMAGELLEGLDPRGYQVHVPERIQGEDDYPFLRRFWVRMPRQGRVSIFIGSWYHEPCRDLVRHKAARRKAEEVYNRINFMERMLVCDGTLLIKFFIHIKRKEQKRRMLHQEKTKSTRLLVTPEDWEQNERYDEWEEQYNRMIAATTNNGAPWHVLSGADKRACKRQIYQIVMTELEKAIAQRRAGQRPWDTPALPGAGSAPTLPMPHLTDMTTLRELETDYKPELDRLQKQLRKLQYELYSRGVPLVLVFEGWDAAGKGGCIRRLTAALDPRGFQVVPIASPTPEEKEHHHLWRFWRTLPQNGNITIYDRSWYGRVMVERIEGFCTEAQWRRAYDELNLFEHELVSQGMVIRKFWLNISPDEQLRRFVARRDDPQKQWKITDEDWRNRAKWDAYASAVDEMLARTHTPDAPWIVVEADDKRFARLKVLSAVASAMESI